MRAAHWRRLEDQRQFNKLVGDWLEGLAKTSGEKHGHLADES